MKTSLTLSKNPRGYTIIIAMGLAIVMLLVASSLAASIKNTAKNIKAFKNVSQAQITAMSIKEILKLEGKDGGYLAKAADCDDAIANLKEYMERTGATPVDTTNQGTTSPYQNAATFTCEAIGATDTNTIIEFDGEDWYAVPAPGTGKAGTNCKAATTDSENPCNWGVMALGTNKSMVTVPLYYKQPGNESSPMHCLHPDDEGYCSFADAPGDPEMVLRVRTPCKDEKKDETNDCDSIDRYQFRYDRDLHKIKKDGETNADTDDTVIYWKISGDCTANPTQRCTLMPADMLDPKLLQRLYPQYNSEIFESAIDQNGKWSGVTKNRVWSTEMRGKIAGQENLPIISEWLLSEVIKPTLQFTLVAPDMKSTYITDYETIPYLEYQLLTKRPISTQETVYKVQANYNGQSYKMMDRVPNRGGLFNYTIQN